MDKRDEGCMRKNVDEICAQFGKTSMQQGEHMWDHEHFHFYIYFFLSHHFKFKYDKFSKLSNAYVS